MPATVPMHLAVALEGAGWHPAAWREPDAEPTELLTASYWTRLVQEAEQGHLDFVTIEDSLAMQSDERGKDDARTDRVRGRLDAALIAARVAPVTRHIGLVPSVVVPHTEPFHTSKAIATIDYISGGRAGVRPLAAAWPNETAHFGRREPGGKERFDEAADYVEVLRRLWDSWEDEAEIRDVATGRFVDVDKLHYIDFEGKWFHVKGPSITPRPPQGQPVVMALAHNAEARDFAARAADVVFITPQDKPTNDLPTQPTHVFADLVVFLDKDKKKAQDRKARLDEKAGENFSSDAPTFTGTPTELADQLQDWQQTGLTGFRLRPAALPHDLQEITRALVPELQSRGAFRKEYKANTLRGRLDLPRPTNRYAAT